MSDTTTPHDKARKRVLLVEDNQVTALAYKRMLEKEGFEVLHISEGNNAFNAIRDQKFDLVLLDLMLPEIDGVEILKRTHADGRKVKAPVVVLSEVDLEMVREEVIRYGVKEFFTKTGSDVQKIMQTIRSLTERRDTEKTAALQVAHTSTQTVTFDLKMATPAPIAARKISGIEPLAVGAGRELVGDKGGKKRFLFVW